ncbi:MAG TPA: hypothetical protein VIA18_33245, partial [Polyangia bacterium]|nr:hypothetical protein [Polyangia bacterium]
RQLGDKPQALRFYRTYLIKVPQASNRTEVLDMIARLERASAEAQAMKTSPPQVVIVQPDALHPAPVAGNALVATAPPRAPTPIYKRWCLWTAVGVVAVGVGLGVGIKPANPSAATNLGTVSPF